MNIELAQKVHGFLTEHPERHDQVHWASDISADFNECGTTGCIAGWTVILHTGKRTLREAVNALGHSAFNTDIAAAQVLEIDEDDASRIFYSDNDRVALERLADLIEENR